MNRDPGSPLGRSVGRLRRGLGGRTELVLFALGGGVLYLTAVLVAAVVLGEGLPAAGWIGFAIAATVVLAASTILAVFLVRSSVGAGSEPPRARAIGSPGIHRVLVVADQGCTGTALTRALAGRLEPRSVEVFVVAPALDSATHYLDSDSDAGRRAAQARLAGTLDALSAAGISARGCVGSESPLEAIADALADFAADEIVMATPPGDRTNWLEEGVVERAAELYDQPVLHLVTEATLSVESRPR